MDAQQEVLELRARERVDRGERLVQQQQLGPRDEGARDRDALLHPAGELPGVLARDAVQAQLVRATASARAIRSGRVSPRARSGNMTLRSTVSHGKSERL